MTAPPSGPTKDVAILLPSFDEGVVLLKSAEGKFLRVSWEAESDAKDRRRALAPGAYEVVQYCIAKKDAAGESWHLSATGKEIRRLSLEAGKTATVDLAAKVWLRTRIANGRLSADIRGEGGAGLTMYRAGKRLPLLYRLLDEKGAEKASGSLAYG